MNRRIPEFSRWFFGAALALACGGATEDPNPTPDGGKGGGLSPGGGSKSGGPTTPELAASAKIPSWAGASGETACRTAWRAAGRTGSSFFRNASKAIAAPLRRSAEPL